MDWALANNLPENCLRPVETEPRLKRDEMVSLGIQVGFFEAVSTTIFETRQQHQLAASSPPLLGLNEGRAERGRGRRVGPCFPGRGSLEGSQCRAGSGVGSHGDRAPAASLKVALTPEGTHSGSRITFYR